MLEAVNTTAMTAGFTRIEAMKVAPARSYAANPERIQEVGPRFTSPYIILDAGFEKAIFAIRDSATGDVLRQFPTESQIRAYQRTLAASQPQTVIEPSASEVRVEVATPETASLDVRVEAPPVQTAPVGTQSSAAQQVTVQASGGAAQSTFSTEA